jgi:hypothetical protein
MNTENRSANVGYRLAPLLLVLTASAGAWLVLFGVIPPSNQNFPLGDDWGLFLWLNGEGIHYLKWASMPELGQWLWAWPWVGVLGQNVVVLRLTTILLSWFGLAAFYDVLRQEGMSAQQSAWVTAVLAFSPLFFLLQGTFMTDVPTLSFSLVALALYGRAFASGRILPVLGAAGAALLAVLSRQNAIAVPLVAAVMLWRRPGLRLWPMAWLSIAVPLGAGAVTYWWFLGRTDILPVAAAWKPVIHYLVLPFIMLHFCGVAALPILSVRPRPASWLGFFLAVGLMGGAVAAWDYNLESVNPYTPTFDMTRLFPYTIPMIGPSGPFAGHFVVGQGPLFLNWNARLVLTVLGCLGGAALLMRLDMFERGIRPGPLLLLAVFQVPLILASPKVYDRYFLFLLPGAFALAGSLAPSSRVGWLAAVGLVGFSALISVALMHDWMEWNRARWELGRWAIAEGIHPWRIEGGFEWNGEYSPGPDAPEPPPDHTPGRLRLISSYDFHFWHVDGQYALAFSVPQHAEVLKSCTYSLWLLPGERTFYLFKYEE